MLYGHVQQLCRKSHRRGKSLPIGSYGFQKGDGTASISPQQQWLQATRFIADQFGNDSITGNYYVKKGNECAETENQHVLESYKT